jgi:malonate transporter and related proteins
MSVLTIVIPIFMLIAVGYVGARAAWLSETAQKGISEFAFNFAMPALLFRGIANAGPMPSGSAGIAVAFFGSAALVWLLATVVTRLVLRRPAIDAATIAITSCYGNVVMIGIPLALAVVGEAAAAPMAILLAVHAPLLWIAGTLHQQSATEASDRSPVRMVLDVLGELAANPLLIAIMAGVVWRAGGLKLPQAIDSSVALLAQAGVPCAQVALGASLTRFAIKGQLPTLSVVLLLKLVAFPAIVCVMAVQVFHLPRASTEVAIIFAAMPAGANAFLFAERTQRVVNSTSGAIALGTLLGAVTCTIVIGCLRWLVEV